MITKIYRYKLAKDTWSEFIEVQKKADQIYSKHITYDLKFVRNLDSNNTITEIHTYPDLCAAKKAEDLHTIEPELDALFSRFMELLDSSTPTPSEEVGETYLIRR